MLELSTLQKYDKKSMYKIYDQWPEIAKNAFQIEMEQIKFDDISHIIFTGMGGSGAIGDIFSSILSKTKIHVDVVKGYDLPNSTNENSLVISTSISGNTKETLAVLDSAKKINCKNITFSSGGEIESYCKKNNLEFRKIQQYHSPRSSFTSFLYSMLKILQPIISVDKHDIDNSIKELMILQNKIDSNNLSKENPALELAEWISDIPLVYYPWGLKSVAIRFKNSLQENAKSHVIIENIIEACHNGIVAWEKPSKINPILLQGEDDNIKTKERWLIIKEYFKEQKIGFKEIQSVKGDILTKLINLIYLLDYATIYKAVLAKTDPSTVYSIDFIKKRL